MNYTLHEMYVAATPCSKHFQPAQRGAVLLIAIASIVAFSLLAAVMISLVSSGSMSNVMSQRGEQAFYLAESGINTLMGLYRSSSSKSEKKQLLNESNNVTYSLNNSEGSFSYNIATWWFAVTSDDGNTIIASSPGTGPEIALLSLNGAAIRIGSSGDLRSVSSIATISSSPSALSIVYSGGPYSALPAGEDIFLATEVQNGQSLGASFRVPMENSLMLPEKYAAFTIYDPAGSAAPFDGSVRFVYGERHNELLNNIQMADGSPMPSGLAIPNSAYIVLEPYLRATVVGQTADGVTRSLAFSMPLSQGGSGTPDTLVKDTVDTSFEVGKGWDEPPLRIAEGFYSGERELRWRPGKVTADGGTVSGSLSGILCIEGSVRDAENFALSMFESSDYSKKVSDQYEKNGGYLSYDVQVKLQHADERYIMGPVARAKKNGLEPASSAASLDFVAVNLMRVTSMRYTIMLPVGSGGVPPDMWMINQPAMQGIIPGLTPGIEYSSTNPSLLGPMFAYAGGGNREYYYDYGAFEVLYNISLPAIVLWEQRNGVRRWLAYKVITESSNTGLRSGLDSGGKTFLFSPKNTVTTNEWNTLLMRVTEGERSEFSGGQQRIKHGDKLTSADGLNTGYSTGQPFVTMHPQWSGNAEGHLLLGLPGISGKLPQGPLYQSLNGSKATSTSTIEQSKAAYVRVYYASLLPQGVSGGDPFDNNRLGKSLTDKSFAPDDYSEWNSSTDQFTLVQWDALNTGVTGFGGETVALSSGSKPAINPTVIQLDDAFVSPELKLKADTEQLPLGFGVITYGNVCLADYAVQFDSYTRGKVGADGDIPPVRD